MKRIVFSKIKQIIKQEVHEDDLLKEDLQINSLKFIMILTNICEETKINIMYLDPSEIMKLKSVGDLTVFLEKAKTLI